MNGIDLSFKHPKEVNSDARISNQTKWKRLIARIIQPQIIVEIGVRAGYSAFAFLTENPKAKYYGFDLNKGTHGGRINFTKWAIEKMAEYNFDFEIDDNFDSQKQDMPIKNADMYHIDGDHTTGGALRDMRQCLSCMSDDGFLVVDDYYYITNVKKAVKQFLKEHPELECVVIKSLRGDAIICKKDSEVAMSKLLQFKKYV